jgi:hypothetical protein
MAGEISLVPSPIISQSVINESQTYLRQIALLYLIDPNELSSTGSPE